jgi:hypothetical protein
MAPGSQEATFLSEDEHEEGESPQEVSKKELVFLSLGGEDRGT